MSPFGIPPDSFEFRHPVLHTLIVLACVAGIAFVVYFSI